MKRKLFNQRGQGFVEYALLIVVIAVVVIAILAFAGHPVITDVYCKVVKDLAKAFIAIKVPAICTP